MCLPYLRLPEMKEVLHQNSQVHTDKLCTICQSNGIVSKTDSFIAVADILEKCVLSLEVFFQSTVKAVLGGYSKLGKTKVFKADRSY